ncbi:MAG: hypothetical protein AAFX06_23740 [Planctomycetota bacterium]
MRMLDSNDTSATSEEVVARVLEQFDKIASACNGLCSLGYGHGWPIRLGQPTSDQRRQSDDSPAESLDPAQIVAPTSHD